MLDLPVPHSVLGQEIGPLLDHLDAKACRGHKDDALLLLDILARLDGGGKLAGKGEIGDPGDTLPVSEQGLLVEESLDRGVSDPTLLPELVGVLGVVFVLRSDKDQPIKVGRSAGLKGELRLESDRAGRDVSLDRPDDLRWGVKKRVSTAASSIEATFDYERTMGMIPAAKKAVLSSVTTAWLNPGKTKIPTCRPLALHTTDQGSAVSHSHDMSFVASTHVKIWFFPVT